MTDLQDYIAARKRDLQSRKDRLSEELKTIQVELDEIDRAERGFKARSALQSSR